MTLRRRSGVEVKREYAEERQQLWQPRVETRQTPAEVIDRILGFLFAQAVEEDGRVIPPDYSDRLLCLVVSRQWFRMTISLLYRDVYLTSYLQVDAFVDAYTSLGTPDPALAPVVQSLRLTAMNRCAPALKRILCQCPSIRKLELPEMCSIEVWRVLYDALHSRPPRQFYLHHFDGPWIGGPQGLAIQSALGSELQSLTLSRIDLVKRESIEQLHSIWRMNTRAPSVRTLLVTGGLRELTLRSGKVSVMFFGMLQDGCPNLRKLAVGPGVAIVPSGDGNKNSFSLPQFVESLNDGLLELEWLADSPIFEGSFDTLLGHLTNLRRLTMHLRYFTIIISRGLSASTLDHLALHPDPQCLGGIKAPALIAKSNGVVQLMGKIANKGWAQSIDWDYEKGLDATVKYEVVKRMLANAEAAGVSGQELDLPVF